MRRSPVEIAALAALFAAALTAHLRLAGGSPIAWIDTVRDEIEVRQCLRDDSCTLAGVETSIPGVSDAVGWLDLRTLLAALGLGIDAQHFVVQVLNALATVLVFHLARQLGGTVAGVLAAWLFMQRLDVLVRFTALHNSTPLLFLGAAFALACCAVLARPGAAAVALAALVGAVLANVHIACVLCGASVIWVALTAPRHRWLLAALGAAVFALATVALAPLAWLRDVLVLLQQPAAHPIAVSTDPRNGVVAIGLFAVGAWTLSLASRSPMAVTYRRRAHGVVAVIVPFLAAFLLAPRFGVNAEAKYLVHLKAACAVAAALPLGFATGALGRRLFRGRRLPPIDSLLPFALALLLLWTHPSAGRGGAMSDDERMPTVDDLERAARLLRDQQGWERARMIERLRTPDGVAVLAALQQTSAAAEAPSAGAVPSDRAAILLALAPNEVPDPLPPQWTILRRTGRAVVVLLTPASSVDWSAFDVCSQADGEPAPQCTRTGWRSDAAAAVSVPGMPPAGGGWRGRFSLSLSVRPVAGTDETVFMPRLLEVCGGRISSAPARAHVDADGRHASLPAGSEAGTLTLEWRVGTPECSIMSSSAVPPFVLAGETATVEPLVAILRAREGAR